MSRAFAKVVEWLHAKRHFNAGMLSEKEPRALVEETFNVLQTPLKDLSISREIPPELTAALEENVFIFSGFKTYHELKEASMLLKDENGGFKTFDRFRQDVEAIDSTYNRNYLAAEYEFAVASSQMAVKWKDLEKDGDRYDLQYRTAGDDRVRPEHAALNGITLPPSDKFWDEYYPPNGWRCRCTAVQVRRGKYPESDPAEAAKAGERATTQIGKDGTNKGKIFRFNPGKQEKIFPPKHPYFPKGCGNCEFKLGFKPGSETCRACMLIRECWGDNTKSERAVLKKHWLHEMESLYPKKVVVNGNGHPMSVGFRKYGNAHLYSDTFGRSSVLQKEDLPNIDVILENATFVKKAGLSKTRKDNIKRFYYYRTTLRDKTIYLNVAEEDFTDKTGKIHRIRYLYSVTDNIK